MPSTEYVTAGFVDLMVNVILPDEEAPASAESGDGVEDLWGAGGGGTATGKTGTRLSEFVEGC